MASGSLGDHSPVVRLEKMADTLYHLELTWSLTDTLRQDDWQLSITPAFTPDFHWAPHLTPTNHHIINQHVFRAPALLVTKGNRELAILPDPDMLAANRGPNWYMDLDAPANRLTLGMSNAAITEHTAFTRKPGGVYPPGTLRFGCYLMVHQTKAGEVPNPWRPLLSFYWNKWGSKAYTASKTNYPLDLDQQSGRAFEWAFGSWKSSVYQEFQLNGKTVGAPQFIVNVTQSPNYPGEVNEREFRSIWNQAWFSSLRTASGLYRYAKRHDREDWLEYANKTKELALAFPQQNGLFPGVIGTEMETVQVNGKSYNRSKGWSTLFFGNSDRNPYDRSAKEAPYHILDMSFTANQMLMWYTELDKDPRLLQYAKTYADALLKLQDAKGFFPAWLDAKTVAPLPHLAQSPETSLSVSFLLRLYHIVREDKYRVAALKALDAVIQHNLLPGQWEDFETYWSCSPFGRDSLAGKKITRNNMYKQNNFCMAWTAEALLDAYRLTKKTRYLQYGQRTLDEMLMTQASWQPPFIYVDAVGGFGVMNYDAEWNDARQSIFAELIMNYGTLLNNAEYRERGMAALRASFLMIYSPENPRTKKQWEARWPFFNASDYGFMMENYGHEGAPSPEGGGIGEFAIFSWGSGAAAEAYSRMIDRYGKDALQ